MKYTIYFKNIMDNWQIDKSYETREEAEKRLKKVRRERALNGKCEIFTTY